jgi:hypothetical protein
MHQLKLVDFTNVAVFLSIDRKRKMLYFVPTAARRLLAQHVNWASSITLSTCQRTSASTVLGTCRMSTIITAGSKPGYKSFAVWPRATWTTISVGFVPLTVNKAMDRNPSSGWLWRSVKRSNNMICEHSLNEKIHKMKKKTKTLIIAVLAMCFAIPTNTYAFWVVNFGTARTLDEGKVGFAAGIGGQMVFLGQPKLTSGFFTIPHAGLRYGLGEQLDAGLRLAPIPLPFSAVGPSFGVNLDIKYCFTKPESKFDFGVVGGFGIAHVLIEENTKYAYSPNAALLGTYNVNKTTHLTVMARYVNLVIPTAPQGASANFVNIAGVSFGLKKDIKPNISILPEVGIYNYDGKIAGSGKSGPGFQYGLMIATSF